jgi:hypothetical protein
MAAERAIARGRERHGLTIGELFPDGDLVAQWVFLVSALSEDLRVTIGRNAEVRDDTGFRLMSYLHRQTIVRLYEARRLVVAVDKHDEVREFATPLLGQFGLDLRDYYLRREGRHSVVEELWEEVRHRSVHYMHVGSDELADLLWSSSGYPAELKISKPDGKADVWLKWVPAVTTIELFGDIQDDDFVAKMRERSALTARIASTWILIAGVAVTLHAHRLGIPAERYVRFADGAGPTDAG